MNTYRAVSGYGKAVYPEGEFDHEFTVTEEQDAINGGHVEIVPRKYLVSSNNYEAGEQGSEVELALVMETEAALIQGGHLERVDKPATTTKKKG